MGAWFGVEGTVYLLHFDRPYRHARHYLGFTTNLEQRLQAHATGNGAHLVEVVSHAGIGFRLVRTWSRLTRRDERRMKGTGSVRLCPVCTPGAGQGRWPAIDAGRHRARPSRAGRCLACRGRLCTVTLASGTRFWRHIPVGRRATPPA